MYSHNEHLGKPTIASDEVHRGSESSTSMIDTVDFYLHGLLSTGALPRSGDSSTKQARLLIHDRRWAGRAPAARPLASINQWPWHSPLSQHRVKLLDGSSVA